MGIREDILETFRLRTKVQEEPKILVGDGSHPSFPYVPLEPFKVIACVYESYQDPRWSFFRPLPYDQYGARTDRAVSFVTAGVDEEDALTKLLLFVQGKPIPLG
jgi:hypothetical protein